MSMNDFNSQGEDSLGRAANRYVTFQITSAIIGGIIFLILLFTVFLPRFNRADRMISAGTQGMPGETTVTIDGRPATDDERRMIEGAMNSKSK